MFKTFKYRIEPNQVQKDIIENYFNISRFVYNSLLAIKINAYQNDKKSILLNDLINTHIPNLVCNHDFLKNKYLPILEFTAIHLSNAYSNFFKKNAGFPKFKKKFKAKPAFKIPNYNSIKIVNNKLNIKLLDSLKISNPKKSLANLNYKSIKSVTITRDTNQHYYASILCECENQTLPEVEDDINKNFSVGIDLGIRNNYTLYDGINIQTFSNINIFKKIETKFKKLHRSISKKVRFSKNWIKAKNKLGKLYFKVKSIRKTFNDQLTTYLIKTYDMITIENLDLESMKQNRLGKQLSDLNFGQFREMLEYKSNWYGKQLNIVDRYFPSSKLCSNCRYLNSSLKRDDYKWTCPKCNHVHDRDENAAENLYYAGLISFEYNLDFITKEKYLSVNI